MTIMVMIKMMIITITIMVMVMAIACLEYIGPTRGLGTQGVYLEELYK